MIRHVASIAEIVEDVDQAVKFYRDILGLTVQHKAGSDYAVVEVSGTLHFGIWGRGQAAELTYGDRNARARIPLGFSIGFEVDSIDSASDAVKSKGVRLEQQRKSESWGQITSRFFSISGALCEFSEMPGARTIIREMETNGEDDAT